MILNLFLQKKLIDKLLVFDEHVVYANSGRDYISYIKTLDV